MHKPARRFDLRLHISQHPLNRLKLSDVLPERAALLREGRRSFERTLRNSDSLRRDTDAPIIERAERNLEPLALFAHAILDRHFAIIEHDLDRRRRVLPHLFFMPP